MLELRGLSTGYGGTPVVHDIDLMVGAGEIVTLVGANGAGKTTLVKTIGLLRAESGQILFDGKRIDVVPFGRPPKNITRPRGAASVIASSCAASLEQATITTSAPKSLVASLTAAGPSCPSVSM